MFYKNTVGNDLSGIRLVFFAIGGGGNAELLLKRAAKVFRIFVADSRGHGFDWLSRSGKQVSGCSHSLVDEQLMRRNTDMLTELRMEMRCAQTCLKGEIVNADRLGVVTFDIGHDSRYSRGKS